MPTSTPVLQFAPRYRDFVLADSPQVYYRLGEIDDGGTTAYDIAGQGYNGTYSTTDIQSRAGALADSDRAKAFESAGETMTATAPQGDTSYRHDAGTAELWIKITTAPGATFTLMKRSDGSTAGWTVTYNPATNALILTVYGQTGTTGTGAPIYGSDTVSQTVDLETNTWRHIAITWTNNVSASHYVDGAQVGVTTAFAGPTPTDVSAEKVTVNTVASGAYDVTIDEVAKYRTLLSAARILAHYNAGAWTALTNDTQLAVAPIVAEYGIRGGGPQDRIATAGTMTFALDNSTTNSGALNGYYSPDHANGREGWDLGCGVRLAITYSGTTYYKWRGWVRNIQPDAGSSQRRSVLVTATDYIDDLARAKMHGLAIQSSQRADQIVTTLVTKSVQRQPAATSYATGQSTFTFALDNLRDESTTVYKAMTDVVNSEVGYLYVKGDTTQGGTLTFEDRHTRPKVGAAAASFDNSMHALVASRSVDRLVNRVLATAHPRKVDSAATTVLYQITSTAVAQVPFVAPLSTITFQGLFRDATGRFIRIGGSNVVQPVATTDYVANSAIDGSGTNLTASITVTATVTSNAAIFTITNTSGSTAYLTLLQIRGKGVQDTFQTLGIAEDIDSQSVYGESALTYDMPYEEDVNVAQGIADWILQTYKDPHTFVESLTLFANDTATLMTQALTREIGDKITVLETMTGLTNVDALGTELGYFINGVSLQIDPGDILMTTWMLAPADTQQYWILNQVGAGELGSTTRLGFA